MSTPDKARSVREGFLSTLLKNLPGMAYRFANDGYWTIEYVSEGALPLTGWQPAQLIGNRERTIFHLAHPDDVEAGYAQVNAALCERRPYQLTYRLIARDGSVKWVFEQGQGVFSPGYEVEAVEGFISDITPQKEAQIALAKSERRFRSIFENAIFGIFQSTPEGRFLILNPYTARILGYDDPDEALQSINDIATELYVDPDERKRFIEAINREGCIAEWISQMRRKDGSMTWVSEKSRGIFGADGELRYIEGTVKDITEEMAAIAALNQSEEKASALRAQLADAQLRALRLQLKPHFLFNVLNTVSMMIRTGENDKAQRMVTLLAEMFRDMLEFEGEETITLERELRFCELYLDVQRFRFEDRLEIRKDIDDSLLEVRVPTLMLQSIAENAIKHGVAKTAGPCRIDVYVRRKGDSLIIEMQNDAASRDDDTAGPGIGVANIRARLRELYGDRAEFNLVRSGRVVRATLSLPIQ